MNARWFWEHLIFVVHNNCIVQWFSSPFDINSTFLCETKVTHCWWLVYCIKTHDTFSLNMCISLINITIVESLILFVHILYQYYRKKKREEFDQFFSLSSCISFLLREVHEKKKFMRFITWYFSCSLVNLSVHISSLSMVYDEYVRVECKFCCFFLLLFLIDF